MNTELKFYVEIRMPAKYQSDEYYDSTIDLVREKVKEIADEVEGRVIDLEIK